MRVMDSGGIVVIILRSNHLPSDIQNPCCHGHRGPAYVKFEPLVLTLSIKLRAMDVPGVGQEKNNKIHPNDWVIYPKTTLPISQFELIQPPH